MSLSLADSLASLTDVFGDNPAVAIRRIEAELPRLIDASAVRNYATASGFTPDTLSAALEVKRVAGQINVLVHAAGIIASLPHILEPGERIESVSLGAGNTGKEFDLLTDRRVAEFKFITWRGGAESIRQNQVFKDYLKLLWDPSGRRKQLFLTGTKQALAFLNGGRALDSVLSKDAHVKTRFAELYAERFSRVGDFVRHVGARVEVVDLCDVVPALGSTPMPAEGPSADEL